MAQTHHGGVSACRWFTPSPTMSSAGPPTSGPSARGAMHRSRQLPSLKTTGLRGVHPAPACRQSQPRLCSGRPRQMLCPVHRAGGDPDVLTSGRPRPSGDSGQHPALNRPSRTAWPSWRPRKVRAGRDVARSARRCDSRQTVGVPVARIRSGAANRGCQSTGPEAGTSTWSGTDVWSLPHFVRSTSTPAGGALRGGRRIRRTPSPPDTGALIAESRLLLRWLDEARLVDVEGPLDDAAQDAIDDVTVTHCCSSSAAAPSPAPS